MDHFWVFKDFNEQIGVDQDSFLCTCHHCNQGSVRSNNYILAPRPGNFGKEGCVLAGGSIECESHLKTWGSEGYRTWEVAFTGVAMSNSVSTNCSSMGVKVTTGVSLLSKFHF